MMLVWSVQEQCFKEGMIRDEKYLRVKCFEVTCDIKLGNIIIPA